MGPSSATVSLARAVILTRSPVLRFCSRGIYCFLACLCLLCVGSLTENCVTHGVEIRLASFLR